MEAIVGRCGAVEVIAAGPLAEWTMWRIHPAGNGRVACSVGEYVTGLVRSKLEMFESLESDTEEPWLEDADVGRLEAAYDAAVSPWYEQIAGRLRRLSAASMVPGGAKALRDVRFVTVSVVNAPWKAETEPLRKSEASAIAAAFAKTIDPGFEPTGEDVYEVADVHAARYMYRDHGSVYEMKFNRCE